MAPKMAPSYLRPTKSSNQKKAAHSNKPGLSLEDTAIGSPTPQSSTIPSSKKQSVKNPTVRDPEFENTQLIPRGIEIIRTPDLSLGSVGGAHPYFGSDPPSDPAKSHEFYKSVVEKSLAGRVERDIDDSIFLSTDTDFVQSVHRAYRSLGEAGLPESEFKAYAQEKLFIGQYSLLENDRRQHFAVRSVEWSLKPLEFDLWRAPPLISLSDSDSSFKPFGFDIYPDCQFWVCDQIINADYRAEIPHVVHRKALGAFCPYFSIEFKPTIGDTRIVENQVAAAGSVSLYNRYCLKLDAHPQPTPEQLKMVRHYGLTMENANWTVWRFEPKMANEAWAGCRMRRLDRGTCMAEQGVRRLLSWINEIHRWGLCEYALECEDDIKHILSGAPINMKVSVIGAGAAGVGALGAGALGVGAAGAAVLGAGV